MKGKVSSEKAKDSIQTINTLKIFKETGYSPEEEKEVKMLAIKSNIMQKIMKCLPLKNSTLKEIPIHKIMKTSGEKPLSIHLATIWWKSHTSQKKDMNKKTTFRRNIFRKMADTPTESFFIKFLCFLPDKFYQAFN